MLRVPPFASARIPLRMRMILLFCAVVGVFLAGNYIFVYSLFETGLQQTRFDRLADRGRPLVALTKFPGGIHSMEALDLHRQFFELYDVNGHSLAKSNTLGAGHLPFTPLPHWPEVTFRTVRGPAGSVREAILPVEINGEHQWLIVSEPTSTIEGLELSFRKKFLLIWSGSMFLTALLATWYVARSLRPIVLLARDAEQLTRRISGAGEYVPTPKLPVRNPYDEVGRLATNFNVLFDRVDLLVQQLRLFISDAAHELRTPLAVLRGETQLLLAQPRGVREYEHALNVIDDELATMDRIIDGLFTLSMADAGQLNFRRESLQLDEVLEEACGIAAPLGREKHISIHKKDLQEVRFEGDGTLLRQLFLILIENAIKYSPPATIVTVALTADSNRVTGVIGDQGIGVAPEHLPHIFKRFYRAESQMGGNRRSGGLGLSIADAIAKVHGGSITCESAPASGSRFTVSFAGGALDAVP